MSRIVGTGRAIVVLPEGTTASTSPSSSNQQPVTPITPSCSSSGTPRFRATVSWTQSPDGGVRTYNSTCLVIADASQYVFRAVLYSINSISPGDRDWSGGNVGDVRPVQVGADGVFTPGGYLINGSWFSSSSGAPFSVSPSGQVQFPLGGITTPAYGPWCTIYGGWGVYIAFSGLQNSDAGGSSIVVECGIDVMFSPH